MGATGPSRCNKDGCGDLIPPLGTNIGLSPLYRNGGLLDRGERGGERLRDLERVNERERGPS